MALACLLTLIGFGVSAIMGSGPNSVIVGRDGQHARAPRRVVAQAPNTHQSATSAPAGPPFAVGIIHLRLVDTSRTVVLPGGETAPRTLLTTVRYPAIGRPGTPERPGATPAVGRFPLIVFGIGFAEESGIYARLLDAWTAAGYVVAAPTFPLSNAHAPGGPNERDLPNQPADMSYVITRLLAADEVSGGPLHHLIKRHALAVAGQSDGGDTALAVAYDPRDRDRRVSAAVILSGAYDPFISTFSIAPGGPALLATQGTADQINLPSATAAFYDPAPPPKYLLQLLGANHLGPYTNGQPQLRVVERVTIAFFNKYLKHQSEPAKRMTRAGTVAGIASFSADP